MTVNDNPLSKLPVCASISCQTNFTESIKLEKTSNTIEVQLLTKHHHVKQTIAPSALSSHSFHNQ